MTAYEPGDQPEAEHEVEQDVEQDVAQDVGSDAGEVVRADAEEEVEPDWVRRRRLDAVFGDGAHGQALGDRWYQEQVPPHHG